MTTSAEALAKLRRQLGESESTEHLIDWVLDFWETKDFLFRLVGREDTDAIVNAEGVCEPDLRHDLVLFTSTVDDSNPSLLYTNQREGRISS